MSEKKYNIYKMNAEALTPPPTQQCCYKVTFNEMQFILIGVL